MPLLSIVIPTRDRARTAATLVRYILDCTTDKTEVIVQDCGALGVLPSALGRWFEHDRLRYEHSGGLVSMTENWNAAARRCRGDYVVYLGDDDAVTPDIELAAIWARHNAVEALVCAEPRPRYFWPDIDDRRLAGTYSIRPFTGQVTRISAIEELEHTRGRVGVGRLPAVYHGMVRRDHFDSLVHGNPPSHFRTVCPDLYSSYRLAMTVRWLHIADYPVIIPGACQSSNHGNAFRLRLGGYSRHKREYGKMQWPKLLPLYETRWIGQVIADGMVQALEDGGRQDLVAGLDLADLYVSAIRADPLLSPINILRYFRAQNMSSRGSSTAAVLLLEEFQRRTSAFVRGRISRLFSSPEPKPELAHGLSNTEDLAYWMMARLKSDGVRPPWSQTSTTD